MSAMTRRLGTTMVVGLLALAGAAACGGSETPRSTRTRTASPSTASPSTASAVPSTTTPPVAPEGWQALPEAPSALGLINVWTGREVLASLRACCQAMDGRVIYAYDPQTRTWRSLPKYPLGSRSGSAFLWTGQDLLQVGGSRDRTNPEAELWDDLVPVRNGMALDPTTGHWRAIADAPRDVPTQVTVWTGTEAIFADSTSLLRYDPSSDRWTVGAPVPGEDRGSPAVVWTGDEVVVWGGHVVHSARWVSVRDGYAYDPVTNRWRTLPAAPIGAWGSVGVWTGQQVLVWGGTSTRNQGAVEYAQTRGAGWDPRTSDWTLTPAAPTESTPRYAGAWTGAWTGRELVAVTTTGTGAAYNPEAGTWRALPPSGWGEWLGPVSSVWTGRSLIVLPVAFGTTGWEYHPGY
jgi:hypothetical protein